METETAKGRQENGNRNGKKTVRERKKNGSIIKQYNPEPRPWVIIFNNKVLFIMLED